MNFLLSSIHEFDHKRIDEKKTCYQAAPCLDMTDQSMVVSGGWLWWALTNCHIFSPNVCRTERESLSTKQGLGIAIFLAFIPLID